MENEFILHPAFHFSGYEQASDRIRERLACRTDTEANFTQTNNHLICCFVDKRLYITDESFFPLLCFESSVSYIAACGISNYGEYAVCSLAYNRDPDAQDESGLTILFDVNNRKAIAARKLEVNPNFTQRILVSEVLKDIIIFPGDKCLPPDNSILVKYDFNLQPDSEYLAEYLDAMENARKKKKSGLRRPLS